MISSSTSQWRQGTFGPVAEGRDVNSNGFSSRFITLTTQVWSVVLDDIKRIVNMWGENKKQKQFFKLPHCCLSCNTLTMNWHPWLYTWGPSCGTNHNEVQSTDYHIQHLTMKTFLYIQSNFSHWSRTENIIIVLVLKGCFDMQTKDSSVLACVEYFLNSSSINALRLHHFLFGCHTWKL